MSLGERAPARKTKEEPAAKQHGRMSPPVLVELAAPRRVIDMTDIELLELLDSAPPRGPPDDEWMDRTDCAKWLKISLPQLDKLCRAGLPFVRLGGDGVRRFCRDDVGTWLRATRAGAQ